MKYLCIILCLLISACAKGQSVEEAGFSSLYPVLNETFQSGGSSVGIKTKKGNTYLVTNAHVCISKEANIYTSVKKEHIKLPIVDLNEELDLCLLQYPEAKTLKFAKHITYQETIYVFGFPYLAATYLSKGKVGMMNRLGSHVVFGSDAIVYPGNSGGPVLNEQGEIVGITEAMLMDNHNAIFIPYSVVHAYVEGIDK